jgi:hypothetical protein
MPRPLAAFLFRIANADIQGFQIRKNLKLFSFIHLIHLQKEVADTEICRNTEDSTLY